jgi:hypothetical protein
MLRLLNSKGILIINLMIDSFYCYANECVLESVVSDISLYLHSFYSWKAVKVSRSANFRAHCLAKWAASHLVFGSIPI